MERKGRKTVVRTRWSVSVLVGVLQPKEHRDQFRWSEHSVAGRRISVRPGTWDTETWETLCNIHKPWVLGIENKYVRNKTVYVMSRLWATETNNL